MAETSQRRRRLARRAFELAVSHALDMIPIVGPAAVFTFELIKAVQEELSGERPMTEKEVLALFHEVPRSERTEIVYDQMSSPAGELATASLGTADTLKMQRALENLPSQLDKLMAEVEADEKATEQAKKLEESQALQALQEEKQRNITKNRSDLTKAMQQQDWYQANIAAQRLMWLGIRDPEVRRAEKFSHRRRKKSGTGQLVYIGQMLAWTVPFFILAFIFTIGDNNLVAGEAMVGLLVLFFRLSTWSSVSPTFRRTMVGVGIAVIAGLWIYASLQLP